MPETVEAKTQRPKGKKYMLVRYGRMNLLGLFEHNENQVPKGPTAVIIKTDRGLEMGILVGQPAGYRGGRFRLDPEQMADYYKTSEMEVSCDCIGRFMRYATSADISEHERFSEIAREEVASCQRLARDMRLNMRVVDAEHVLGGERIIFYFTAEGRIDFRDLVHKLSHEFQTRIEMRQIGARDEAKLLGDVESCGQECCCRRFLRYLKPVNMRMAKMQKATLDPSKISGYCGRLKCCLRYEDLTYAELKQRLPRKNSRVSTSKGEGRVVDGQILTQLVVVEFVNGDREAFPVSEITVVGPGTPPSSKQNEDDEKPDDKPRHD
jgi:cell fate regulator YaaT (PSP1 superfamily)